MCFRASAQPKSMTVSTVLMPCLVASLYLNVRPEHREVDGTCSKCLCSSNATAYLPVAVHYALVDITAAAEQCAMLPDGLIAWASALACMPEILQLSLYIAACAVQAVRLDQLTYTALQEIDSHPLVCPLYTCHMPCLSFCVLLFSLHLSSSAPACDLLYQQCRVRQTCGSGYCFQV